MKKLLAVFVSFLLVFSLAGCLSQREELEDIEVVVLDELPDEEISITFRHVYGQKKELLLLEMIAEFELLYPNISVESEPVGGYPDVLSKTKKDIGTGVTPDLVVGYPDHFAEYLDLGGIIPLDKFIEHETWGIDLTDFVTSYVEENQQFGDEMYSLPYSKSTEMMIYNKRVFDANNIVIPEDGVTWTDIEGWATTLVGSGDDQCDYMINYDSSANLFINASRQWGAGYTNIDGDILVDNQTTRDMLAYFRGLFEDKTLSLPIAWEDSGGYGSGHFLLEDVCMTVGSTAGLSYNLPSENLDEADQFDVGILPIPQFEGAEYTESAMQQGPNIAILENTSDAERLASWLLIKFLTNTENTVRWAFDTGYLPVRYSGYESDDYQALLNNPDPDYVFESMNAQAAYAQLDIYDFDPAFAGIGLISSSKAREEAGYLMETMYAGVVVPANAKSIDTLIQEMLDALTW